MTQQPRTPTTEAGRYYVERLRKDEHRFHRGGEVLITDYVAEALDAVLAIEANLVAQIEKIGRSMHRAVFATMGRCEGAHALGQADCQQLSHELGLAAIRSAAPVEPEP